jgi:membrane-associated phospholipid phosphatase
MVARREAGASLAMLGFVGLLVLATLFCMWFVDQPVAGFFAAHRTWRFFFQLCAAPSLLALPVAGIVLANAVLARLRGARAIGRVWLVSSVATLAGTAAKDELKWMFGRPWPSTWLHYGTYQFHPFAESMLFGGFPSGHTAYISAPLCVLWVLAPRYRIFWGGIIALVMFGLVAAGYHFVGDVLAGLLTGIVCAWGTLVLMKPRNA